MGSKSKMITETGLTKFTHKNLFMGCGDRKANTVKKK
jgi:hypothetical protein